jgi:hypothetical protein
VAQVLITRAFRYIQEQGRFLQKYLYGRLRRSMLDHLPGRTFEPYHAHVSPVSNAISGKLISKMGELI